MLQRNLPEEVKARRKSEYKEWKRRVRRLIEESKRRVDEEFGRKLCQNFSENKKLFWKEVKKVRGGALSLSPLYRYSILILPSHSSPPSIPFTHASFWLLPSLISLPSHLPYSPLLHSFHSRLPWPHIRSLISLPYHLPDSPLLHSFHPYPLPSCPPLFPFHIISLIPHYSLPFTLILFASYPPLFPFRRVPVPGCRGKGTK